MLTRYSVRLSIARRPSDCARHHRLAPTAADQADPGNGAVTVRHAWWEVYQPVDYALTSRLGDDQQFRSMVTACRAPPV